MNKARHLDFGRAHWLSILTTSICFALLASTSLQAAEREFTLTIEEIQISIAPDLDYKVFAFNS